MQLLPARIFVLTLCRCLEEEMIISHCVRVNHKLFTEWIIIQPHTEWCYIWQDENSALHWHCCSDNTLEILLPAKKVNSCCLCCWVSLLDSPALFHVRGLQTIIIYCSPGGANRKMFFVGAPDPWFYRGLVKHVWKDTVGWTLRSNLFSTKEKAVCMLPW